jgi:dihydroorotate dehydrogenase
MDRKSRPGTDGAHVDLRVNLAGLQLRNPVVTASGTFASGREYADFVDLSHLGAVVTKGVSLEPSACRTRVSRPSPATISGGLPSRTCR